MVSIFTVKEILCGSSNLVYDNEEKAIDQNRPDEDVAKDTGYQGRRMRHHDSSIPVDGNECPRQGPRHHGQVNETSIAGVSEVERGQVNEVEDNDYLGPGEVRAHEEHDEGKMK